MSVAVGTESDASGRVEEEKGAVKKGKISVFFKKIRRNSKTKEGIEKKASPKISSGSSQGKLIAVEPEVHEDVDQEGGASNGSSSRNIDVNGVPMSSGENDNTKKLSRRTRRKTSVRSQEIVPENDMDQGTSSQESKVVEEIKSDNAEPKPNSVAIKTFNLSDVMAGGLDALVEAYTEVSTLNAKKQDNEMTPAMAKQKL